MAGPTVTVACKLPHGLILRVFDTRERPVPVLGGGTRMEVEAIPQSKTYKLNGVATFAKEAPKAPMSSGFALTHGIPKDFWDRWLEQNKELDAVENGLIFAHEKESMTAGEAKEKVTLKSGLEPLDPKNLPRGIKPADDKEAA